jgi:DNA-binding transcriptional LysR family regulator
MVACASPQYLAQHGTPVHPSELAQHEVISYSYWAARNEWTFTAPDGTPVVARTHARIHANNGDTCRAAALHHQGIILQPDFIVADDLRRGDLVELMPTYHAMTLGIHAVYPSRKHLPIKTRRLVDFLVEAFAVPGWNVPQ